MDPVPVSSYGLLSYMFQFLVTFIFISFLFPMKPHKLRIHILKHKISREKILHKPELLAHDFLSMIHFKTYYLILGPSADTNICYLTCAMILCKNILTTSIL